VQSESPNKSGYQICNPLITRRVTRIHATIVISNKIPAPSTKKFRLEFDSVSAHEFCAPTCKVNSIQLLDCGLELSKRNVNTKSFAGLELLSVGTFASRVLSCLLLAIQIHRIRFH
jgi:hypothetical protein